MACRLQQRPRGGRHVEHGGSGGGVRAVTWEARTNLRFGGCQVSRRASFCGDSASHGMVAKARGSTPVTSTVAMPAAITGWATPARIRPAAWAVTSGASSPGPLRTSRTRWDGGMSSLNPCSRNPAWAPRSRARV